MLETRDELLDVVEAVVEHGDISLVLLGRGGRDVIGGCLAADPVTLARAVTRALEI